MTPTEQDKELREKLYSIFEIDCDYYSPTFQNGCGYDGFYCKLHATMLDNAAQLITAHTNAEIAKVLDRLEGQVTIYKAVTHNEFGVPRTIVVAHAVPESAVEAERNKLKERDDETK